MSVTGAAEFGVANSAQLCGQLSCTEASSSDPHQLEEGWAVADLIAVLEKGRLQYIRRRSDTDFDSFRTSYEELQ